MYQFWRKLTDVVHNYEPTDNGLILIRGDYKTSFLEILDLESYSSVQIDKDTAYDFINLYDRVIFTNKLANKSYVFNKKSKVASELPYTLHIKGYKNNDRYLCYSEIDNQECFLIISLDTLNVLDKYAVELDLGLIHSFLEYGIVWSKRKTGTVSLTQLPNKEVWKLNTGDYVKAQTPMPLIDNVYVHENRIYTLCGHHIICTSLDGTLVWNRELEFRPVILEIDKNMGYMVSSNNVAALNLNNGSTFYSKKMNQIIWQGYELFFQGFHPRIYNQKLWCTIQTNGLNFVAALNMENGALEWLQNIETPHFINPPKFDDKRMFILDNGGNLFIYDKTTG